MCKVPHFRTLERKLTRMIEVIHQNRYINIHEQNCLILEFFKKIPHYIRKGIILSL